MSTTEERPEVGEATAQRHTLPARAYRDPAVLEAEGREVFSRAWMHVCHVSQVAEPGSYFTTSIAGEPVVVLRGDDGELRALSNVCRHRAMLLLDGQGSCPKVMRCPYHGWTYRQDGQLAAVPEARGFRALDREAVRLPRFQVAELCGFVWVNLDPEAPPIEGWFGDLPERLGALNIERLEPVGPYVSEYRGNWKTIADNYLEGYHIPVGHPGLLRLLDYKRYRATNGLRHSWIGGPWRDKPSKNRLERAYQRLVRPMKDFPEELRGSWNYAHLYPATMIDIYPDCIDTWVIEPLGVDRVRTVSWVYVDPEDGLRGRIVRRLNWRINTAVMAEDDVLTRNVQTGLEARTYTRGVLNDAENAVWHFHDMLRDAVPGIDDD